MHDRNSSHLRRVVSQGDELFFALAQSFADHAICILNSCGEVCSWNTGAETMLGYGPSEILGQHFSCFCPEVRVPGETEDTGFHAAVLQQATDQHSFEAGAWCLRKNKTRFHAHILISRVDAQPPDQPHFILVVRNQTGMADAQQAFFESEQRFRVLVQGVRDYAIYMLDPDGYVTNWNSGAELIKGYQENEIIGQHFSCFYTPGERDRGEPQRSLDLALKHNTFQNEAWRVRKDGSRFWASVVIDPIFDENHNLLGFAKITRDITEQKRAQEKTAQQRDALHQSQKLEAVGRLTGSVAHDFNNFLAIIRTAAELMESSATLTPEKRLRYTQMILDTTNRAGRLIEQLLSFARRQPMQRQVFSVDSRIQEFLPIIETTVGSKRTLKLLFDDGLEPVDTDANQFETAVLNMVINARDATAEGGVITISGSHAVLDWHGEDGALEKRDFTALSVSDDGPGIEPAVLANIFEPFFTTKSVDKGTGLGLSQVYGFAKQSGGDVVVDTTVGKGTCFTLYLPCASDDEQDWDGVLSPLAQKMFQQD